MAEYLYQGTTNLNFFIVLLEIFQGTLEGKQVSNIRKVTYYLYF